MKKSIFKNIYYSIELFMSITTNIKWAIEHISKYENINEKYQKSYISRDKARVSEHKFN